MVWISGHWVEEKMPMDLDLIVFLLTDVDVAKIFGALVQEGFGVRKAQDLEARKNLLGAILPLEITSLPETSKSRAKASENQAQHAARLISASFEKHKIPFLGLALSDENDGSFAWVLGNHSALCKDHDDCKGEESLSRACVTRDVMAKAVARKIPRKAPAKKPVKRK